MTDPMLVGVVVDAADKVEARLEPTRRGFTVTERLDGVTLEAMKELMRNVV
jgi:hypothetical protein